MKRAYELSVCITDGSYRIPTIALAGVPGGMALASTVTSMPSQNVSVRRVLFSFHIVEIS
ncbi:hypothetical protein C1Y08_07310 [Pseudomonas sp. FW306-02-F02-AA]|nr:hypothetical protein C1Y07_08165 [Pseudomonas sp. FW306-02-F02-AB]PMZ09350.1 hypothetical protein C1Y06_14345 [Pseudomonas sp. FW306-02-H06C]PMZ16587.1 hypothetical protein C1Y08_07310 [Pseudomonas sp. FW306-02-F02-AA]PMZ21002.1 hypothetical protein C1Y09_15665 [Pseudomonas sp. FW306-02-F08-AA]PMZ27949.1 hypothetical protein C1Y05_10325 [Pseudomonas sp. FW306-02-F04-BA]PMZ35074.1 hypothetical protein C1X99_08095 [Pseudomonas sp. FW306-02-H06B]PMZ40778.1 hypothetical protein C1Y00_10015 [Ps